MIEVIFITMERWHCIDLVLRNMELAKKPKDTQILTVISGSNEYFNYVNGRLEKIFYKVKVVRNYETGVEHDEIRKEKEANEKKTNNIFNAYRLALSNRDHSADYYWIIEDDTLFPLDILNRYQAIMAGFYADIVSGVSYYWHKEMLRNFWNIEVTKIFPDDTCQEISCNISSMKQQNKGIIELGATGLGNVLIRSRAFKGWEPQYRIIEHGADIDFFAYAKINGFRAYGIWDIYLPHITKYENGDIAILGRLDKSLIQVINKNNGKF